MKQIKIAFISTKTTTTRFLTNWLFAGIQKRFIRMQILLYVCDSIIVRFAGKNMADFESFEQFRMEEIQPEEKCW